MSQDIILPCKECISYAICIGEELILCDEIWSKLENCSISSYQERLWTIICQILPNMKRVRWETNPYPVHQWHNPEPRVYRRST